MSKIILTPEMLAQLNGLRETLELCDETGRLLGVFTPRPDRSLYEQVEIPFTEEELRRAESEPGGRTLAEILADLEKRQ